MSKKMLKRSLALGALMAFVITGQALAAKATLGQDNYLVNSQGQYIAHGISNYGNGIKGVSEWELGQYTLWVDQAAFQDNAIQLPKFEITGDSEGSTLLIKAGEGKSIKYGLALTGNVDVDKVYIEVDEQAIKAEGAGNISVTANEIILKVKDGSAVYACKEGNVGSVTITPKEKLEIYSDAEAVRANSGTSITIASPEDQKADIIINGNVDTLNGATVDLKLETAASVLNGSVNAYEGNTTQYQGTRNITLSSGATWNVTGVSDVTTFSGDSGNIVVSDVTEEQVTIGTDNSTKLTVAAAANAIGLTGNAEADLKAVSNSVVTGTNENKKAAADTAKITGGSVYDEISAEIKEDGTLGNINKQVASANISVNDMAAIGLMSWRAEMNDMNKRMGELRNANGEHGVWVRMVRGESEYNSVKNQYNQYQLGYDEKLSTDPSWTVGVALSYTDAENNFAQGNGESTNKALSIYGSKLNDDGTFVDLIAKYARLENDFETFSGMGAADYDANGYSFSAEFGKRIQQGKGLWIEPQVELTYGRVGSVDYVSENGVSVAQDSMDSLVGRIGFSLGKDIEKGNVYARASYLYDFDGETKATLDNDAVLKNDLGGGWWEVGVGANINLSKATYIYADVEKTFGGEVDTNWQWNLGVRYSF